jgi:hypothetical protein
MKPCPFCGLELVLLSADEQDQTWHTHRHPENPDCYLSNKLFVADNWDQRVAQAAAKMAQLGKLLVSGRKAK